MGRFGQRVVTGLTAMLAGAFRNGPLSVTANSVSRTQRGFDSSGTVTTVSTPNTTASGGAGGCTYAWTLIDGVDVTVSSATAQNPTFSAGVNGGETNTSTWQVTVTDAASDTASTTITVSLTWVQF